MTAVSDYGAEIWYHGQKQYLRQLQTLQNKVLRKILGVFRISPDGPMESEANIPPPAIRIQQKIQKYALRVILFESTSPTSIRTSVSFPPEFPSGFDMESMNKNKYKN